MNEKELKAKLKEIGVPKRCYAINGDLGSDKLILNKVYYYWECFYFDERGGQNEYKTFRSEDEACRYFFKKLEKYGLKGKQRDMKFRFKNGDIVSGKISLQENVSEEENLVSIELRLLQNKYYAQAESYFEALQFVRKDLEQDAVQILCNGAARNAYPSPTILRRGKGRHAYILTLGQPALMENFVDIFNYDDSLSYCSVEEQNQYYSKWIESLKGTIWLYQWKFFC